MSRRHYLNNFVSIKFIVRIFLTMTIRPEGGEIASDDRELPMMKMRRISGGWERNTVTDM
jgi:hypothetical protein